MPKSVPCGISKSEREAFVRQYIETALWSSTDESTESGGCPLDDNYDASDLADEAAKQMRDDCESFLDSEAGRILVEICRDDDMWERAGHDFWLTRNCHGAGFWDGDWPGDTGQKLTDLSRAYGECNLIVGDDGRIYAA